LFSSFVFSFLSASFFHAGWLAASSTFSFSPDFHFFAVISSIFDLPLASMMGFIAAFRHTGYLMLILRRLHFLHMLFAYFSSFHFDDSAIAADAAFLSIFRSRRRQPRRFLSPLISLRLSCFFFFL
jgi:hypothetical protein